MALYKGSERICPIISTDSPQPSKVEEKAVTFYDQNGDPVYSYDYAEAAALTELPEIPALEGYVGDCWNATLEDIHGLEAPHLMDIGPIYKVDLGNGQSSKDVTQITFELPYRECELDIHFQQDVDGGVTIDWGDGSPTETVSGTGLVSATHTYEQTTDRIKKLRLTPAEGCQLILGDIPEYENDYEFIGIGGMNSEYSMDIKIVDIYIGRADIGHNAFSYRPVSGMVLFSNNNINIGRRCLEDIAFSGCVIFPPLIETLEYMLFDYCILKKVIFNQNIESLCYDDSYVFYALGCERMVLPKSVQLSQSIVDTVAMTKIFDSQLSDYYQVTYSMEGLETMIIGPSFGDEGEVWFIFGDCYPLRTIIFDKNFQELPEEMFELQYNRVHVLHFGYCTQVVTAQSTTFDTIPDFCIFVVPDDLYDEWIQAEYWSDHADQIVKLSEYEELS